MTQFGRYEIVTYDPADPDTFPSVCSTPDDVHDRFGFTGGETLLFSASGDYKGQLVKRLFGPDE